MYTRFYKNLRLFFSEIGRFGLVGPQGIRGRTGMRGLKGAQGRVGLQGFKGFNGIVLDMFIDATLFFLDRILHS